MRFIAITRLISSVPPEQLPSLMERFADWREQYREHLESFEFFAGSTGGFMVINVPDEVILNQLMAEYPCSLPRHRNPPHHRWRYWSCPMVAGDATHVGRF